MKVVYGPLADDASGRFGGLVASKWKGIQLFRRFQSPSNPNTANQREVRDAFSTLNNIFRRLPAEMLAAWNNPASGRPLLGRNLFIGENVPLIKADADLDDIILSIGGAGAVPCATITVTGGVDTITVAATVGTTPVGWTLLGVVLGIVESLDPSPPADPQPAEFLDAVAPYTNPFTGLNVANYVGVAFPKYTAPDGSTRYGRALSGVAAAT